MSSRKPGLGKKIYASVLAVTTLVWGLGVAAIPQTFAAQIHSEGSVVISNGTIYKIENCTKRGFPSAAVFLSHGYSFGSAVAATSGDVALADGAVMTFADGTLVNDNGTVYIVNDGVKRGFVSGAVFTGLGYSFANVVSGSTASLSAGAPIESASAAHPAGTLVLAGGTVWKISASGRMGVPSMAVFNSYGWSFSNVVAANSADTALAVAGEVQARNNGGSLVDDSACGQQAGPSAVSVALASDTPASATVLASATRVPFTKVVITNTTNSEATIDHLVVERGGVASDSSFSGILLIDPSTNVLMDNEKSLNSNHQATFTKDFKVAAGSSKAVLVAARMAAAASAGNGETPKLGVVTVSLTNGSTTGLPVFGNAMTINDTVSIGTVTFAEAGDTPSASTQNVGTKDYVFDRIRVTAGSAEDIEFSQITWTQEETAATGDVENLQFKNDATGEILASGTLNADKEVTFTFSPITIEKGENASFAIEGDIISGSGRLIDFMIDGGEDAVVKGKTHGFFLHDGSMDDLGDDNDTTIGNGSLTVSAAAGFAASNVAEGATDVTIGKFDMTAKGENTIVSRIALVVDLTASGSGTYSDVTNVEILDGSGKVVAGPFDLTQIASGDDGSATSTDTFTVSVGTTTYTVRADLSSDFDTNDTIAVSIKPAQMTVKGETTNNTLTMASTEVTSATQTIKSGALVVSVLSEPIAQSVVRGTQDFTFTKVHLDASGSSEDIRITQIKAAIHTNASSDPADVSGLQILEGSTVLSTSNDPDPTSTTADAEATSTFTFSNAIVIAKGATKTLTIRGDISASATANGTYALGIQDGTPVSATGVSTGNSVTPTYNFGDGSTMTFVTAGTLTLAADASSPSAGLLAANKSDQTVAVLSALAQNEAINIEKLYLTAAQVNSGGWDQVDAVKIYDGSTLVASATPTSSDAANRTVLFDISSSPIQVPANTTKKFTVKVDTANVDRFLGSKGASGEGFDLKINATGDVTAKGASSGQSATISGTPDWNDFKVHASVPTFTKQNVSSTTVSNGVMDLYKFTVSADSAGDIGLAQFAFAINTTSVDVTDLQVIEEDTSTTLNATGVGQTAGQRWGSDTQTAYRLFVDVGLNNYRTVPAGSSRTYILRGNISNAATAGDTISVVLLGDRTALGEATADAFGSGHVAGVTHGTQGSLTGSNGFVWSDLNYSSTTTATATDQWTNGYLVSGLTSTTTSQVLSR